MLHYVRKLLSLKGLIHFPVHYIIKGWDLQPCFFEMVITVAELYGPYCNRSFQIERGDPSHKFDELG